MEVFFEELQLAVTRYFAEQHQINRLKISHMHNIFDHSATIRQSANITFYMTDTCFSDNNTF